MLLLGGFASIAGACACSSSVGLTDGGDASERPAACAHTFEYLDSDTFAPPHPMPRAPVPPPVPLPGGINRVVRPETGAIGVRSWWLESPDDARVTLSITASADILTGSDSLTVWCTINGRPAPIALSSAPAEWRDRLEVAVTDDSATLTVRLNPASLGVGRNTLHFFYTLATPGAVVRYWDDAFPTIMLFVGGTDAADIEIDDEAIVAARPRITYGLAEVSLGADGPTTAHLEGVERISAGGLFVQSQVTESMAECGERGRYAYLVLLDDVVVPVGPHGEDVVMVEVPPDQRVAVPLAIGELPQDGAPHRLQVRQIGGIGLPLEDDDGGLVPWGHSQSRLADIVW